tara:strand:+ start:315 stop:734 length:420 start_codon:yes stop_codon:yes gene_type:complete
MNNKINIEFILGLLILIISIICIFYYSSRINLFNKIETFQINSSFFDIGNVNIGNDVKNEEKRTSNYSVQTSSFKKISKSKKHITLLKNKIKILRNLEHQIKKNGSYFISYINVADHRTAKNLCDEIKLFKLDCLIKTS